MEQGKVKWFSQEKGYGFITSSSGIDHYFNVQAVNGADLPTNGDNVSFQSKPGNKGAKAISVIVTAKSVQAKPRHVDDRVNCPSCNKKIVPRMITYQGEPQKSVCPYCASTVMNFESSNFVSYIFIAAVIWLIIVMM